MKGTKKGFISTLMLCLYIAVLFVALLYMVIKLCDHFNLDKRKSNSFVNYYKESLILDYNVLYNESSIIDQDELPDDSSYVLKYTDSINLDYHYKMEKSKELNLISKYQIYADVTSSYSNTGKSDNEIYKKKFVLDEGTIDMTNQEVNFDKEVPVDINYYNSLLKDLQTDINLTLSGEVDIYLIVDTYREDGLRLNKFENKVTIPLLQDVYKVDTENVEGTPNYAYSDDLTVNKAYVLRVGLIALLDFCTIVASVVYLLMKDTIKSERKIKKLLKTYDDFIVNIKDPIKESKYEVIEIDEFKEILTLANNNFTTIMYYRSKNGTGNFYCILDKYLYVYRIETREGNEKK